MSSCVLDILLSFLCLVVGRLVAHFFILVPSCGRVMCVPSYTPQCRLLERFWHGAHVGEAKVPFVLKGEEWKRFGFQRDDPVSDLRACGRLAMEQLVYAPLPPPPSLLSLPLNLGPAYCSVYAYAAMR